MLSQKKRISYSFCILKANTLKMLLTIGDKHHQNTHREAKISIKLEIDTNPPLRFQVESKLVLNPTPFYVLSYSESDLFAGKMHAV